MGNGGGEATCSAHIIPHIASYWVPHTPHVFIGSLILDIGSLISLILHVGVPYLDPHIRDAEGTYRVFMGCQTDTDCIDVRVQGP